MLSASPSGNTPSCLPSVAMTRTSRARIFPFTLTNGPEEEEEREGKGRLKTPSSVETYSCISNELIGNCQCLAKHKFGNSQVNNCKIHSGGRILRHGVRTWLTL